MTGSSVSPRLNSPSLTRPSTSPRRSVLIALSGLPTAAAPASTSANVSRWPTSWASISPACGVSRAAASARETSSWADTVCCTPRSCSASRTDGESTSAVIVSAGACLRSSTALTSTSPSLVPVISACSAPAGRARAITASSVGLPRTTCTPDRAAAGSTSATCTTGMPAPASSSRIAGTVGDMPTMRR